ncbi:MAG: hypothetical protein DWI64_07535 [Chloroflexi bacterium]|nr:MAG: hypothetical protein DWI64_07535 [Chloroflexota bacterium]
MRKRTMSSNLKGIRTYGAPIIMALALILTGCFGSSAPAAAAPEADAAPAVAAEAPAGDAENMNATLQAETVALRAQLTEMLTAQPAGAENGAEAATPEPGHAAEPTPAAEAGHEAAAGMDIVDTAIHAGHFTTLIKAVEAAGLVEALKAAGPMTLLAPTDAAFAALPPETLAALLMPENKAELINLLMYHVMTAKAMAADISGLNGNSTNTGLEGKQIAVAVEHDKIMLNTTVAVTIADIIATNGVIHEINGVLMPEGSSFMAGAAAEGHGTAAAGAHDAPAGEMDIVATASQTGHFTKLVAAIEAAGLAETLKGVGPFTLLAPTDAAFAALPAGTLDNLLNPDNKQKLVDLLMYHVIMAKAVASDVASLNGRTANTGLTGKKLNITVDNDTVMINGNVKVTAADIMATNGVIHEINGVLSADGTSVVAADGAPAAHAGAQWEYEGAIGPAAWGALSADYATCSSGMSQSPIDIRIYQPLGLEDIGFSYQPVPMKIKNNGHTIQANIDAGNSITVDGVVFNLLQFHFHTPSEHTLLGRALPMELHLVHKDADGNLAVVGVLITIGAANANFAEIWSHMPAVADEEQPVPAPLNPLTLLPKDRRAYRYSGSLTTPPCSEGVNWLLLATPIQMSTDQIAAFRTLFPLNARPVQPLHDRPVLVDVTIGG